MSKPKKDHYYLEQRKKTIIIGIEHKPTPEHFDHLFEFDIEGGYDLFFNPIRDFYLVSVGSKIGEKLAKLPFFEDSSWKIKRTKEKDKDIIFSPKTSKLIENSKDSKIWDEVASRCFGCGICSYVCPLCYCFETLDEISLGDNKKCRYRRWDSCLLPEFFEISGGVNLKEKLRDRIYNWYYHKFVRMPEEYGHPGCVGCGRCIAQCPAKINFRNVLENLIKESKKK
jgi:sulfhydrogenase subunit beta (sulfur reductase)